MLCAHGHQFEFISSIEVGHHQVEQDEIWFVFANGIIEAQALCCHKGFITFVSQGLSEQISNSWIVIHNENFFCHSTLQSPHLKSIAFHTREAKALSLNAHSYYNIMLCEMYALYDYFLQCYITLLFVWTSPPPLHRRKGICCM